MKRSVWSEDDTRGLQYWVRCAPPDDLLDTRTCTNLPTHTHRLVSDHIKITDLVTGRVWSVSHLWSRTVIYGHEQSISRHILCSRESLKRKTSQNKKNFNICIVNLRLIRDYTYSLIERRRSEGWVKNESPSLVKVERIEKKNFFNKIRRLKVQL